MPDAPVADSLKGAEDGELYLEYGQSESLVLDDGSIRSASFDTSQGFGLRSVVGEVSGYAHSGELSEAAIKRAATAVQAVHGGHGGARSRRSFGGGLELGRGLDHDLFNVA